MSNPHGSVPPKGVGRSRMKINAEEAVAANFWLAARTAREARFSSSRDTWRNEVEAMDAQLLAAKLRLNDFSPIYALPTEILARIFELLATLDPIRALRRRWGWACITHVSRRFRAVAIGHASLWSRLSVDGQTPWNLFLPRARGTLLSVHGEIQTDQQSQLYAALTLQNIERMQAIEVSNVIPEAYEWHGILRSVAPKLQTLSLGLDMDDDPSDWSDSDEAERAENVPQHMRPQFLTKNAPNLTSLSLAGIRMCWKLNAPIALRSLSLHGSVRRNPPHLVFSSVLGCLRNMPLLQHLALKNILPPSTRRDVDARVSMPHLRSLSSAEPDGRCLGLWASLDVPSTCSIRIGAAELDSVGATTWKELLLEQLAKRQKNPYRHVRFEDPATGAQWMDDHEVIQFTVSSVVLDESTIAGLRYSDEPHDTDDDATLTFAFLFSGPAQPFRDLSGVASPTDFHHGRLHLKGAFSMECVTTLLTRVTTLESVEICGWYDSRRSSTVFQEFVQVYYCALLDKHPSTGYALPSVRSLSLRNVHLRQRFIDDRGRGSNDRLCDTLCEMLRRRYFADIAIRTVKISGTVVDDSWIQPWENYVDEVHCDETCFEYGDPNNESSDETSETESLSRLLSEDDSEQWGEDEDEEDDDEE
ncbi:unnamed protein product [Peniophora sp. CBMAI 1063]|nr:unnamed protein product [Peniophora sp. CBMAI 1063]